MPELRPRPGLSASPRAPARIPGGFALENGQNGHDRDAAPEFDPALSIEENLNNWATQAAALGVGLGDGECFLCLRAIVGRQSFSYEGLRLCPNCALDRASQLVHERPRGFSDEVVLEDVAPDVRGGWVQLQREPLPEPPFPRPKCGKDEMIPALKVLQDSRVDKTILKLGKYDQREFLENLVSELVGEPLLSLVDGTPEPGQDDGRKYQLVAEYLAFMNQYLEDDGKALGDASTEEALQRVYEYMERLGKSAAMDMMLLCALLRWKDAPMFKQIISKSLRTLRATPNLPALLEFVERLGKSPILDLMHLYALLRLEDVAKLQEIISRSLRTLRATPNLPALLEHMERLGESPILRTMLLCALLRSEDVAKLQEIISRSLRTLRDEPNLPALQRLRVTEALSDALQRRKHVQQHWGYWQKGTV